MDLFVFIDINICSQRQVYFLLYKMGFYPWRRSLWICGLNFWLLNSAAMIHNKLLNVFFEPVCKIQLATWSLYDAPLHSYVLLHYSNIRQLTQPGFWQFYKNKFCIIPSSGFNFYLSSIFYLCFKSRWERGDTYYSCPSF
jgi:hypothetical protein